MRRPSIPCLVVTYADVQPSDRLWVIDEFRRVSGIEPPTGEHVSIVLAPGVRAVRKASSSALIQAR